ncbi:hypothetical protein AB6M11_001590 [Listeria monocytogenes]|uniref:hypothetical protein n=1 Tax=Listeria monocytogenes TaxID=1639 RepID=UPI000FA66AB3|nr:hypothetical protein [Listeria monocytogenes]EAC9042653.1 hypothetical protein [Listeria monocytogenes]EAD0635751.1 hypothetical protein [Listeria monocytogenes]EAD1457091.1 hypothetical protein [Listeria monocytogenes]EAE2396301.1 hypothetical protein [Listeria monocytogenes]EAG9219340.1 hypothetical protein [Listeria monocytogenes]
MTKIVKMSEKNEHGTLEQFYPETHAEAVKGLVSITEEDKTTWSGKETTAGAEQKANAALNSAKDYVDTIGEGTVIFKGSNLMGAGQSYKWDASKVKFGMTLLFSRYDPNNNTPQDYYYFPVFVSKAQLVEIAGGGILIQMPSVTYGDRKYLYVSTSGVSGHADNSKYNSWALRQVTIM